jgi:hypothetical protein
VYGVPDFISGTPTQAELDAQPRLFSWGELKEIISECSGRGRWVVGRGPWGSKEAWSPLR